MKICTSSIYTVFWEASIIFLYIHVYKGEGERIEEVAMLLYSFVSLAKLHGTAHATIVQLMEEIPQWVNTKMPIYFSMLWMNIDTCLWLLLILEIP